MVNRNQNRMSSGCSRCGGVRNDNQNRSGNGNACQGCGNERYQLQMIDFSIVDTILYLDAYPNSREALEYLQKLKCEREKLLSAMEKRGCPPVTALEGERNGSWDWTDSPWPWEPEANGTR